MSNELQPLDEQEQKTLVALYQAFLRVPHAEKFRLHFYADTGGGLTDTSGQTKNDERLVCHWLDLAEGLEMLQAMSPEEEEEHS